MMVSKATLIRAAILATVIAAIQFAVLPHVLAGKSRYYTGIVSGVAVGGYDPVAYFTVGKPVKGKKQFETEWDGTKWRFSSAENREAFLATPESYKPKYGGYCAYAVGIGRTAHGDPKQWKIVDGKLYLNYSSGIKRTWEKRQTYYIKAGDKNWPRVLK